MSTETPKPNPAMFAPARNGFQRIGEEAKKGGEALAKLEESIKQNKEQGVKRPFIRREHLTQRPFLSPELITMRKGFDRHSAKIKKK